MALTKKFSLPNIQTKRNANTKAIDALLLQKIHTPSASINGMAAAQCVATLLSTDGLGPSDEKICDDAFVVLQCY